MRHFNPVPSAGGGSVLTAERDLGTHHASRSTAVPEQSREQGINAPTLSGFGVLHAFGHRRSDRAVYGNTHVRTERGEVRQVLNFRSNMSIRGAQNLTWVVAILSELA